MKFLESELSIYNRVEGTFEGLVFMFKKVVLGADGSETSQDAARIARELGLLKGSEVLIVAAFGDEDPINLRLVAQDDLDKAGLEERFLKSLQVVEGPLKAAGLKTSIEMRPGQPHVVIIKTADAEEADLIVIGRRGHGTVKHILIGSVSSKVIQYSQVPILVVPEEAKTETGHKTLFVPVDFSSDSLKALRLARQIAKDLKAKIVLFNCVRTVYENVQERLADAQKKLNLFVEKIKQEGLEASAVVAHGDLLERFVEESDKAQASLIVMSSHGRTGARKLWLGSIAEAILKKTSRPVLVIPLRISSSGTFKRPSRP
jgi:nucleotide-binding universal stress UspA family protein